MCPAAGVGLGDRSGPPRVGPAGRRPGEVSRSDASDPGTVAHLPVSQGRASFTSSIRAAPAVVGLATAASRGFRCGPAARADACSLMGA